MKKNNGIIVSIISYWNVLRLVFVLFFLYLTGDAFYRWDGFSFYASFSEFLPSVAFVSIMYSISAGLTSFIIWLPLKAFEWFRQRIGWKIGAENLLIFLFCFVLCCFVLFLFFGCFVLLNGTTWAINIVSKVILLGDASKFQLKLAIMLCVVLATSFLTWILSGKLNNIIERITPLVWLFSIIVILSVPIVVYHIWTEDSDTVSKELSQASEAGKSRPNIILVTFDALTARDMSSYGYNRPTTPFISEWSKSASLFTRAKAESNITGPSTASLMTGKRSWTHQVYHMPEHSKPVKSNTENLGLMLKKNNYYTIADVVNPAAIPEALGISQGFDNIRYLQEDPYYREWLHRLTRGKIRLYDWTLQRRLSPGWILIYIFNHQYIQKLFSEKAVREIKSPKNFNWFLSQDNFPEPYFAWIHIMPPHDPYSPPKPYFGMFEALPEKGNFSQRAAFDKIKATERVYQHFTKEVQPLVYTLRARYDEYIRYCDKEFEDFIASLEKRGQLNKTVVILSSDHGESFEHDYIIHGREHLYEQVTHVPLIIKEAYQTEGQIINELVSQIDIPATILNLANISPPPWMDGRSLLPLLRGEKLSPVPVFSMNFQQNRGRGYQITKGTIAVWEENYKLIHYLDKNQSLLFNLREDPGETNNLFDNESEIGKRLLTLIQDSLNKANEKMSMGN